MNNKYGVKLGKKKTRQLADAVIFLVLVKLFMHPFCDSAYMPLDTISLSVVSF